MDGLRWPSDISSKTIRSSRGQKGRSHSTDMTHKCQPGTPNRQATVSYFHHLCAKYHSVWDKQYGETVGYPYWSRMLSASSRPDPD